jgi:probable phosphoglycerate mutase
MKSAAAHVDGASRGNPGEAGFGVYFEEKGLPAEEIYGYLGSPHTNNYAEYQALLAALRHALGRGVDSLSVFSDSLLLVRQMEGRFKVRHPNLQPLHAEARSLVRRLKRFSIAHVPREKNRKADRLANLALDRKAGPVEAQKFSAGLPFGCA